VKFSNTILLSPKWTNQCKGTTVFETGGQISLETNLREMFDSVNLPYLVDENVYQK
jgi:hypothetical protein